MGYQMKKDKKESEIEKTALWWSHIGQPIRPGGDEIRIIEEQLPTGQDLSALILGATPEFVNLLLRRKAKKIVVIDHYEPHVKAMDILGGQDWSSVEVVLSDWRTENKNLEKTFNVILGDNAFLFTRYPEDWKNLSRILHGYLAPGGRFVLRSFFKPTKPFDFDHHLDETLKRVMEIRQEMPSDANMSIFRNEITNLRTGTTMAVIDAGSRCSARERDKLIQSARDKLAGLFKETPYWNTIDNILFVDAFKKGEYSVSSVPPLEEVSKLLLNTGFSSVLDIPSGDRPFKGAVSVLVARKTGS